jgi:integrase
VERNRPRKPNQREAGEPDRFQDRRELADVVVNKAEGKYASAHDFRRTFGTRWAKRVMPVVLQKLMRHSSIETTLRYYVDLDADEVGDELWKSYGPAGGKRPAEALPHTLPHTCPDWAKKQERASADATTETL